MVADYRRYLSEVYHQANPEQSRLVPILGSRNFDRGACRDVCSSPGISSGLRMNYVSPRWFIDVTHCWFCELLQSGVDAHDIIGPALEGIVSLRPQPGAHPTPPPPPHSRPPTNSRHSHCIQTVKGSGFNKGPTHLIFLSQRLKYWSLLGPAQAPPPPPLPLSVGTPQIFGVGLKKTGVGVI